jgi:maltoporin
MMNRHSDRFSIFNGNENEIRRLSKKLDYSVDDILSAVQEVGFDEDEIEEYIRDRQERSLW